MKAALAGKFSVKRVLKQFCTMPRTFRQWTAELIGGVFWGLAVLFVLFFCSPPLPFHSATCATGWNDPVNLLTALFFIALARGWHWLIGHPVPAPIR